MSQIVPLLLAGWMTPTLETRIVGEAAFSYHIASAAAVRNMALSDPGCALMSCGDLGRHVWVLVNGRWIGPLTSVDCAQKNHFADNVARGRVIDLPWSLWDELSLPLAPVPVTVSFVPPSPDRPPQIAQSRRLLPMRPRARREHLLRTFHKAEKGRERPKSNRRNQ
jgi:hypothetical protein